MNETYNALLIFPLHVGSAFSHKRKKVLSFSKLRLPLHPANAVIVRWCNGSTTDYGSVCPGSNPGRTTTTALQSDKLQGFFFSAPNTLIFNCNCSTFTDLNLSIWLLVSPLKK